MNIGYVNDVVYWVKIPIGVIDGASEDRAGDLGLEVTNPEDGGRLPWAVIEETDKKKVLAVMLEPPVTATRNSALRLTLRWRGAYKQLIHDMQDNGKVTLEHPTNRIQIKFIAPLGLEFSTIRMKGRIGDYEIKKQDDGRSILIWTATDLIESNCSYTLVCKHQE